VILKVFSNLNDSMINFKNKIILVWSWGNLRDYFDSRDNVHVLVANNVDRLLGSDLLFSHFQNHRITESQNSRGWKGPLWVI